PLHFIGTNAMFHGNGVSEARLDTTQGQPLVEIDVDGDGNMTANDMTIELDAMSGTLSDANFLSAGPINQAPSLALANTVAATPENGGNLKVADIVVTDD